MFHKKKKYLVVMFLICVLLIGQMNRNVTYTIKASSISDTLSGEEALEKRYNEKKADQEILGLQSISPEKEDAIFSLDDEFGTVDMDSKNSKNYAGLYLNSHQEIVVQVTSKNNDIMQRVEKNMNGEKAVVREVKYSLNQLKQQMKLIEEFYEKRFLIAKGEEKEILQSIKAFYIDVEKNAVVVRIKENNIYKENYVRNHVGGKVTLLFENTKYDNKEVTSLSSGQGIRVDSQNGYCAVCSIGYRVWWPNSSGHPEYGFITCAHGLEIGQGVYTSNHFSDSNYIGYVCNRKYGDNVDASVVLVQNNSYNMANHIYGTSSYLTDGMFYPSVYQGMSVGKVGQTTGCTYGTVTAPVLSVTTLDGITISDCFETTNLAANGDSGGVAFTYDSSTYVTAIDGITRSTNGVHSHYVKYMNIYNAFGTNAY